MTGPRTGLEVQAEQIAVAREAVQQAMAANAEVDAHARQLLSTGSDTSATPVTPAHTD